MYIVWEVKSIGVNDTSLMLPHLMKSRLLFFTLEMLKMGSRTIGHDYLEQPMPRTQQ